MKKTEEGIEREEEEEKEEWNRLEVNEISSCLFCCRTPLGYSEPPTR
jgi:hypothetical protein